MPKDSAGILNERFLNCRQQLDFDLRVHLLGQQDTNLMVLQSARSGKLQDWLMFLSPTYPGDLGDIIRVRARIHALISKAN